MGSILGSPILGNYHNWVHGYIIEFAHVIVGSDVGLGYGVGTADQKEGELGCRCRTLLRKDIRIHRCWSLSKFGTGYAPLIEFALEQQP